MKKYLVGVITATLLALNLTVTPASASTGCDSKEQTLVNAINAITNSAGLSSITTAASNYRSCLSTYADSRNSYASYFYTAGGFYYSIMTAWNTYALAGRSYGMKAAADYRMNLLGEESTINTKTGSSTCHTTYQNLIGAALGSGDIGLASHGQNAYDDCVNIRTLPSAKPSIVYSGLLGVGTKLQARSGTWPYDVSTSFQWYRGASAISGETNSTYSVQAADAGYQISLKVTGSRSGLYSVSRFSANTDTIRVPLTLTPTPTVNGTRKTGFTLTANPGTWDAGTSLSYVWLRNGTEIGIATSPTYTLTNFDVNNVISVKVTGSKQGYQTVSKVSDGSQVFGLDLTLTPAPTFTGTKVVGNTLTAVPGNWDAGVSLSYQWLNDGNDIAGATSSTYVLQGTDYQHQISVRVTGSKFGYSNTSKSSAASAIGIGTLVGVPEPFIFGTVATGKTLRAVMPVVDSFVTFEYQWLLDGKPIADATDEEYVVAPSDFNHGISVRMSATKLGYKTLTGTSPVSQVAGATQTLTPTPTISGTFKVGQTLTANPGTWGSGINLAFEWLRDGTVIPGATSATYTAVGEDYLKTLSVRVTGSAFGFLTATTTSTGATVAVSTLASSATPVMDGNFTVGKDVSCSPNGSQWDPGVSFEYVWLRDGVAIGAPNSETYRPTPQDLAHTIACKVIGTKLGYTTKTLTSNAVTVSPGVFNHYALMSGDLKVGSTVTLDRNQWPAEASISVQWYRTVNMQGAFEAIPGETSLSHRITVAEAGYNIWARVAISSPGYVTVDENYWNGLLTTGTQMVQTLGESNPPTYSGAQRLGSAITIGPGVWDAGTSTSITILGWDGSVAATASCVGSGNCVWFGPQVDAQGRFIPSLSDKGYALNVTVTGTYLGQSATTLTYMPISEGIFDTSKMPLITGEMRPGKTVSVDMSTAFPGATVTYQWGYFGQFPGQEFMVGVNGATESSFVIPEYFLVNKFTLGLTVTISAPGFAYATHSYPGVQLLPRIMTRQPTPVLSGIPKVGNTLSVNKGLWDPLVTTVVTLYRDGVLLPGLPAFGYLLTASDVGRRITAKVTATLNGYESVTTTSVGLLVLPGSMSVAIPSITGTVKVGKVLNAKIGKFVTAKTSSWVSGATITYQWLLDGKAIKGATAKTYKPLKTQKGKKLSLTVTQKRAGYTTATKTSSAVKIG